MQSYPMHIAAIDDEFDVREILKYNLTKEGFQVTTFADPLEALEKLKSFRPDIILTDWLMPEMDGIQFTRIIKSRPETAAIPVIMITCKGSPSDQELAFRTGANDYLIKPFRIKDLLLRINKIINP